MALVLWANAAAAFTADEAERIACLDKFCAGDVVPRVDQSREVAFKKNGKWFSILRDYGDPNLGELGFYWPSATPLRDARLASNAPEFSPSKAGVVSNYHQVAVQVFLTGQRRWPRSDAGAPWERTWEQFLRKEIAKGTRFEQTNVRPGLDSVRAYRATDGKLDRIYFVATAEDRMRGAGPPVLSCDANQHPLSVCAGGEFLRTDVYADFRFNARNAENWPQIHQKIVHMLGLIKDL